MYMKNLASIAIALLILVYGVRCRADSTLSVACERADGVFDVGQTIVWHVQWNGPGDIKSASYVLKSGGREVVDKGDLSLPGGKTTLSIKLDKPNTILADVTVISTDGIEHHGLGGAVAAP